MRRRRALRKSVVWSLSLIIYKQKTVWKMSVGLDNLEKGRDTTNAMPIPTRLD